MDVRRILDDRSTRVVAGLTVAAAVLRIVYTVAYAPTPTGDGATFLELARNLARGDGLSLLGADGDLHASASHPPMLPTVVAVADRIGLDGITSQRIVIALLASLAVPFTASAGRRIGGTAVGVVAGAIAAFHPVWIQPAGVLFAEPLHLTAIAATIWAALRVTDDPSPRHAALLGAASAAAALTRSEAAALVALAAVLVVVVGSRRHGARRAAVACAGVVVAATALLGPWLVRNHQSVGTTSMSTNLGVTLAGSNCAETYPGGIDFGTWSAPCAFIYAAPYVDRTEVERDAELRSDALEYVSEHRGDLPAVVAARLGRMWGLFAPNAQLRFDLGEGERHAAVQRGAHVVHWLLLGPFILGAALLVRRSPALAAVVLTPVAIAIGIAVVFYGGTRMRVVAEPSIAILAAFGLVQVAQALRSRSRPVTV